MSHASLHFFYFPFVFFMLMLISFVWTGLYNVYLPINLKDYQTAKDKERGTLEYGVIMWYDIFIQACRVSHYLSTWCSSISSFETVCKSCCICDGLLLYWSDIPTSREIHLTCMALKPLKRTSELELSLAANNNLYNFLFSKSNYIRSRV